MVETNDVTFFEERMIKPNSRPSYVEFELENKTATLNDPQQEVGDETDRVEPDSKMDDRELHVKDIRDKTYIDNGTNTDTQRSDDDECPQNVENRDLNIGKPRDHPYARRMKSGNIGKLPTQFGFEKVILCAATQATDKNDLAPSYLDAIIREDEVMPHHG